MVTNFIRNTIVRIFLSVALLIPVFVNAQVEKYTDILDIPDFLSDSSITAFDDKVDSSIWSTIDTVFYAKGMIVFEINPDQAFFLPDTFFCNLTLEVKTYDSTNTLITTSTKDLTIHYDTVRNSPYNNRSVLYFDNVYRIEAKYTHIDYQQGNGSILPPAIFRLSAQVNVLRTYNFDCDDSPSFNSDSYDAVHDRLDVTWLPYPGATDYDFEWTFYDDSSQVVKEKNLGYVNLDSVFRFNATRITLKGTSASVPLIYPSGFIFYRVRAVKVLDGFQNLFSEWSNDTSDNFPVDWHESTLTWQSNISFAEEGKRKEVASYFDGSLRNRQTVTRINQVDTAVVGETIYDFQGRPAVKVLPTPAFDPQIKYYPQFNVDPNGDDYSWVNFDTASCGNTPDYMDSISGSSRYYSPSNPLFNKAPYKFIPDAEGYPFSVTEYTPDNTGRISRQSGVGPYLMFNDSVHRETRYYYGKPSQWQLDRLFGNDVGDSSHYAEEMVIDPNGQISITYKDAHDRVIATALAGTPPPNLIQLPEYMPDSNVRTFLRENNHIEDRSWLSSTSFLARSSGDFTFYYSLFPDFIQEPNCDNDSLCYDCYYDIKISIGSTCSPDPYMNVPLVTKSYKNYQLPRNDSIFYDTLCTSPDSSLLDSFVVNLEPGSYFISRQITISDSAIDFYKERFLRENACNTFETFYENEMAALDSSGCVTCETCLQQLGDTATFLAGFFSSWDTITPGVADTIKALEIYSETYQTCMLLCNPYDVCGIKKQIMMGDFTPGSQYAKYNTTRNPDGTEPRSFSSDHSSILYWNGNECKFNSPPNGVLPYIDDSGDTIKVIINGIEKTLEQLSPEEFVSYYDQSWAPALLKLHPEYCYLKFCEENSGTHEYYNDMVLVSTYDAAFDSGYTDPLGSGNPDPFFATESGTSFVSLMQDRIDRYTWVDFDEYYTPPLNPDTSCHSRYMSMWDLAILTAIRGVLPAGFSNCDTLDINSLCAGDKNIAWMVFRGLYNKVRDSIFHRLEYAYVRDGSKCDMAVDKGNCCIGSALPQYYELGHPCTGFVSDTYCCEHYFSKVPRFFYVPPSSPLDWNDYSDGASWTTQQKLDEHCEDVCRGHRIYWERKLLEYCGNISDSTMDTLLDMFQEICEHGCDIDHPIGASTVPAGDVLSPGTFQEAMEFVLGISPVNPSCNALIFDEPRPYENSGKITVNEIIFPKPPECVCEKFDSLYRLMIIDTAGTTLDSFAVYLAENYGSQLTIDQLYQIKLHCHDTVCKNMTEPIILPQVLSCGDCLNCDSVNNAFQDFKTTYADVMASPDINALLKGYFNLRFGFHLNAEDYVQFMMACNIDTTGVPNLVTCDSIRELFAEYIISAPSQSLDEWLDSLLNLDYSYTDYSMWIYNCAFDTLNPGYIPCDTLLKYRNAFYDTGYPADSFVTWMNDTLYINFNYLQYAAWITNCDSTDSIPYSGTIAFRMRRPDSSHTLNSSPSSKHTNAAPKRPVARREVPKSKERIKTDFEKALEKRNTKLGNAVKQAPGEKNTTQKRLYPEYGNKIPADTVSPASSSSVQPTIHRPGKPTTFSPEKFMKSIGSWKTMDNFKTSASRTPGLNTLLASADPYMIPAEAIEMNSIGNAGFMIMPGSCLDLADALIAYNNIDTGFHPPLTVWLNYYLDDNLSYSDYITLIASCGLTMPGYSVECDSLNDHILDCLEGGDLCMVDNCLNEVSGLDFSIHEYLQWFDSCNITFIDCSELEVALDSYKSLDISRAPPITIYLQSYFNIRLTYQEWMDLIEGCSLAEPASAFDCDNLSSVYKDCFWSDPGNVINCLNSYYGLEFLWSEYKQWFDSCNLAYLDCEILTEALTEYYSIPSYSRPPFDIWINSELGLSFGLDVYLELMAHCGIEDSTTGPNCDSLQSALNNCSGTVPYSQLEACLDSTLQIDISLHDYVLWTSQCSMSLINCDTLMDALNLYYAIGAGIRPPLAVFLDDFFNISLNIEDYIALFAGCMHDPVDYADCDSIEIIYGICSGSVPPYLIDSCLNTFTGLSLTLDSYLSWLDSCSIPHDSINCEMLAVAVSEYPCWQDTMSLTAWLNLYLQLNQTDLYYILYMDSCGISSPCCTNLSNYIIEYPCFSTSSDLYTWLDTVFNVSLPDSFWINMMDSCGINFPCDTCTWLENLVGNYPCQDTITLANWLNAESGWTLSDTAWFALIDTCDIEYPCSISCAELQMITLDYPCDSIITLAEWLTNETSFMYSDSTWLVMLDTCEIALPCLPDCDSLQDLEASYPCNSGIPVTTWLNDTLNLSFSVEEWQYVFIECPVDTVHCICPSLDSLIPLYPCNDTLALYEWLNAQTGWSFSDAQYFALMDSCDLTWDTLCIMCDSLVAVEAGYPCNSGIPITTWLNDTLDLSYSDDEWQVIFINCPVDTMHCICPPLDSLLPLYPCNDTLALYEWLNLETGWSLSDAEYFALMDSCDITWDTLCVTCDSLVAIEDGYPCNSGIPITTWLNDTLDLSYSDAEWQQIFINCPVDTMHCICPPLDSLITLYPCNDSLSLTEWLDSQTGWNISDSTYLSLLDSCNISWDSLCVTCDSLQAIENSYPCNSGIPITTWLNDTLDLSYSDAEWQQIFVDCPIDTMHCICPPLDSLLPLYPCNDTLALYEWLNLETGWSLSDAEYFALMDSCGITWDTLCVTCDSLVAIEDDYPCNSGIPITTWLNDTLDLNYSDAEWHQIFIDCPVDTMHCICPPLDSLITLYPCNDSLSLTEWLDSQTGWNISDSAYLALLDSCNISWDSLCVTCDSLQAIEDSYPCNSGIPITTWLNDTLDLSYSEAEWQEIFIDCPVDTMNCICTPLDSLIPFYPCDSTLSLVDWLNSETGWNLSDSMYLFYLDSCKIGWDTLCTDCDTLQLLQYSYPCNSSLTMGEWFNQQLNLSFTDLEWDHILTECRVDFACDSCSYLDSLIVLYPCADTLTLSEWLNLQTGWTKNDSQYISMLDSCDLYDLWQAQCDSCDGDFSFDYDSLNCHTVHFYDQSAPTIAVVTYMWYFGDNLGSTSTSENPSFTYSVNDTFDVCLVITHRDSSGNLLCTDSVCKPVIIVPTPTVSIAVDSAAFCEGQTHVLVATGSAGVTSYSWTPGGSTNDSLNVSAAGTYLVTVGNGYCYASDSQVISIYDTIPPGIIVIGSTNLCTGTTTDLDVDMDSYNDPASQYLWSTSETTNLITVDTAGTYCVSVLDAHGCFVHACQEITESISPDPPIIEPFGILNLCSSDSGSTAVGDSIRCINYTNGLLWSTSETTPSIFVDYEDIFNVTYTDSNGCYSTSNTVSVIFNSYTISPDTILSDHPGNISCEGIAVVLTQSGGVLASGINQPNDPAYWAWYTDSCGGTLVDTGASVTVNPLTTTTYYVRAEGPCSDGCDSITITVESCNPCEVLDSLLNIYPCNDTLSIAGWLNYQTNQNLTDSAWLALVDSCELDSTWIPFCIPSCDTLQVLEHSFPCDSSFTLAAWLNDTLNLSYTEQEWDSIFVWCPPDTLCGLDSCGIYSSLYNRWESDGTLGPLEVWLNWQVSASYTYWEYVQLLDSCGIYPQIPCDTIDSLIAIYTPLPAPKPFFSLWASAELGLQIPDAVFTLMLDSCDTVPPPNECDTLVLFSDFFYSYYPAQNIYAWLNSTLGYSLSFYQYQLWFDSCDVYCDTCSYFDSLYTYYTLNNISTPVADWLNQQSGLNNSFWDYVHMLDGCIEFFLPCDTLEYIATLYNATPQPHVLFESYVNSYFTIGYSMQAYALMIDSCNPSIDSVVCDSVHDFYYDRYLVLNPVPDLTTWYNDTLQVNIGYWDYVYWFDSCDIELFLPCDTITDLFNYYQANISPTPPFEDWMNGHLQLHYSYLHYIDMLDTCNILPSSCDSLDMAVEAYLAQPDTSLDFVDYLNTYLGQSLTLEDYQSELAACHNDTNLLLCDNGIVEPTPDSLYTENCLDDFINLAYTNAEHSYQLYLDSISGAFVEKYVTHCLNSFNEDFYMDGPFSEYHYTLYYYDQAGNLAQTIPPNGAIPFSDPDTLEEIAEFRKDPYGAATPHYQNSPYATQYNYNTLNQPVGQHTPDADSSHFWYDRVGRLCASQNAQQLITDFYSYSLYDDLGRIVETGVVTAPMYATMSDVISRNPVAFDLWVNSGSKIEVTHTFYDITAFNPSPGFTQANLRSRVASVTWEYNDDADSLTYMTASHYTYDISGNVKTILQEFNIGTLGNYLHRIDYDYDLVSGKVNYVYFQKDSVDQFIHHYEYDDDNRITHVYTSRDGMLWDEDAHYEYYLHGPLARTELGQHKVQGVDYAYTLQGWMKGINASILDTTHDMGNDGTWPATGFSRDAYGFSLGYFYQDYEQIDPTVKFEADYTGLGFGSTFGDSSFGNAANLGLYNGNIRHSVLSMDSMNYPNIGYVYQYDQLNRLKTMDAFSGLTVLNLWGTNPVLEDYKELVDYDPNGNILNYLRRGTVTGVNPLEMDSMTYNYTSGKNQLEYVTDYIAGGNYSIDIDDQSAANYIYDGNGNLIEDVSEGLTMQWFNNGKLFTVDNSITSDALLFVYDCNGNRVAKSYYNNATSVTTVTYYARDAQGNILATYDRVDADTVRLKELNIYGSSRIGILAEDTLITCSGCSPAVSNGTASLYTGRKLYELTNHLGNVLSTITDKKIYYDANSDSAADFSIPELASQQDYYPFGMPMPGRSLTLANYKFGFNGKENDNEVKGFGNWQDYGMRYYDPRLARFPSVDLLTGKYPFYTPYQFAGNKPTIATDLDGMEENIIIRWYDPNNPQQWIGSTALKVSNRNDRLLGQTGILYLQLDKTPANEAMANRLFDASTNSQGARNNRAFSTTMAANGFISNGQLVSQNAFYQSSSIPADRIEQGAIDIVQKKLSESENLTQSSRASGSVYGPKPFIGFDQDDSNFNPNLDIDNNGRSNQQEVEGSILFLKQNPTVIAEVIGNASSETITRNNSVLAGERATTVQQKISSSVDGNRVSATANFTDNPQPNVPLDRNAKVNFNIPRKQ